jgi:hypothetical protein
LRPARFRFGCEKVRSGPTEPGGKCAGSPRGWPYFFPGRASLSGGGELLAAGGPTHTAFHAQRDPPDGHYDASADGHGHGDGHRDDDRHAHCDDDRHANSDDPPDVESYRHPDVDGYRNADSSHGDSDADSAAAHRDLHSAADSHWDSHADSVFSRADADSHAD